jgi:predicted Rossmann-fold nucleotide-binding protein
VFNSGVSLFLESNMPQPLPFEPIRTSLYTARELMGTLDQDDYKSFEHTVDFRCFAYYVAHGRSVPRDPLASMFEALHDNSITQATLALLRGRPRIAAIMGGHDEPRGSNVYSGVANISAALCREGFLMASGGGPGAMEAAHLGACFRDDPAALGGAIAELKGSAPTLPANADKVIGANGHIEQSIVRALHAWIMPAYRLSQAAHGESLALPTWYYGHEPSTPFATHIAKYFQNSIREDGLIALAAHGIVFASGKAGTLQEIFQDSVRNYYRHEGDSFSPMVFLGKEYWTKELPATPLLKALFKNAKREKEYDDNVLITDDGNQAVEFLVRKAPRANAHLERLRGLGAVL